MIGLRRTARRPVARAGVVYAVLAFLLFAPALVWGRVLTVSPAALGFPPFAARDGAAAAAYANPNLHDLARVFFAWLSTTHAAVTAGRFPAWNPLIGGGLPFYANPQTQVASPFTPLLYAFGFPYGLAVMAWARMVTAALAAYAFARSLDRSAPAAFLTGIAYGGCAFMVIWVSHPLSGVFAVMPLVLAAGEQVIRRGRVRDVAWLALAVAACALSGHPGTFADVIFALGIYAVTRLVVARRPLRALASRLALVVAAVVLGVGLAAFALLPVWDALQGTRGAAERAGGGGAVPLDVTRTLLLPDWWGRPASGLFGGPSRVNYNERTVYAGIVVLILAMTGVVHRAEWRRKAPFLALILIGVIGTYGLHPAILVLRVLPGVNNTPLHRLEIFVFLGVCMLAGFGLDQFTRRSIAAATGLAAVVAVAGLLLLPRGGTDLVGAVRLALLTSGPSHARTAALAATGWLVVVVVAVGVVAAVTRHTSRRRVVAALIVLAVLDAARFDHGSQEMTPEALVVAHTPPSVSYLARHVGSGRIAGYGDTLPPDTAMLYGLRDVRSYDPPQPSIGFMRAWQLINRARRPFELTIFQIPQAGRWLIDLLAVRYVIGPPTGPLAAPAAMRLVYQSSDARILENTEALPRVSVPPQVTTTTSNDAAYALLRTGAVAPARRVIATNATPIAAGQGSARITRDGAARVVIDAAMRRGGLVVLADTAAPGWTVSVDSHAARGLVVDGVVRGVVVPAGSHRVEWRYEVPGLGAGIVVSITALGAFCLLVGGAAWHERPPRRVPGDRTALAGGTGGS